MAVSLWEGHRERVAGFSALGSSLEERKEEENSGPLSLSFEVPWGTRVFISGPLCHDQFFLSCKRIAILSQALLHVGGLVRVRGSNYMTSQALS